MFFLDASKTAAIKHKVEVVTYQPTSLVIRTFLSEPLVETWSIHTPPWYVSNFVRNNTTKTNEETKRKPFMCGCTYLHGLSKAIGKLKRLS